MTIKYSAICACILCGVAFVDICVHRFSVLKSVALVSGDETVSAGQLLPYKYSAFSSISQHLQPREDPTTESTVTQYWKQQALSTPDYGHPYGTGYGSHGLYSKDDDPSPQNFRNGWQIATLRRQLAAAGIPRNITDDLERMGVLSLVDAISSGTVSAIKLATPALEGELTSFTDGNPDAGSGPAVVDVLSDPKLPQPQPS
eukprot:CAMPEP_0113667970 /NCGR_PEP_ID=MMETSP0038_2-20120614/3738_1 /TAXON_ID=2898 /ORGANISM="Cryptomonas paramecium" /LENGTH=200 /DNA_ID=CAMNT_0000583657 /DNA_START=53 /DNA_END=651 /DNA_ORIENTATION=+ /assembly_acc=CAM_ASM_000170